MDDPADVIRDLRSRAGLSQRDLAQRARTSQSAVARYERGGAVPSWQTLQRLAAACGYRLTISDEPLADEDDLRVAESLLELSPLERVRALQRYARLRALSGPAA